MSTVHLLSGTSGNVRQAAVLCGEQTVYQATWDRKLATCRKCLMSRQPCTCTPTSQCDACLQYGEVRRTMSGNAKRIAVTEKSLPHSPNQGKMNKGEEAYQAFMLGVPENIAVLFQPFPLYLGTRIVYWFDFLTIQRSGHMFIHEVKGGRVTQAGNVVGNWTDDARVKFKLAQDKYKHVFTFVLAIHVPYGHQAMHGEWMMKENPNG